MFSLFAFRFSLFAFRFSLDGTIELFYINFDNVLITQLCENKRRMVFAVSVVFHVFAFSLCTFRFFSFSPFRFLLYRFIAGSLVFQVAFSAQKSLIHHLMEKNSAKLI